MGKFFLYSDGGSRNNPGPAAAGWLLKSKEGKLLKKGGRFLGQATNNEAEYQALLEGLKESLNFEPESLTCFLDSSLVVNQLNGTFKIKEARLKELVFEVKSLEKKFAEVSYQYIPREQNKEADGIVNQILNRNESA